MKDNKWAILVHRFLPLLAESISLNSSFQWETVTDGLNQAVLQPVFRIRIHRIHMFLGLQDPDPDPSIIMQKNSKKNLDSLYFVTLFDFLSLKNDVNVPSKSNKQKKLC